MISNIHPDSKYSSRQQKKPPERAALFHCRQTPKSGFNDRDDLAVLDEFHLAVLEGEEGEVATLTDVLSGVDLRAALADDDGAGLESLAVVSLDAEILRIGIAAVTCRCGASHIELPPLRDSLDGGDGDRLAMTDETTIAFTALGLEVQDLLAALEPVDDESNLGSLDIRGADLERRAVADGANGIQDRFLANFDRELFNLDLVTDLDKRLLAAGFEYCVCFHCFFLF